MKDAALIIHFHFIFFCNVWHVSNSIAGRCYAVGIRCKKWTLFISDEKKRLIRFFYSCAVWIEPHNKKLFLKVNVIDQTQSTSLSNFPLRSKNVINTGFIFCTPLFCPKGNIVHLFSDSLKYV